MRLTTALLFVPLVLAGLLAAPAVAAPLNGRADLLVSRVSVALFGSYVSESSPRRSRQISRLEAVHAARTHRAYASRTLLYAALAGFFGALVGVYLAGGAFVVLRGVEFRPDALAPATAAVGAFTSGPVRRFAALAAAGAIGGSSGALGTYWARWWHLGQRASARASAIDATLPRTVAFVYALSRSGMPLPRVLQTLAGNREVYGEAAREVDVTVREMDTFGSDVLTSLRGLAGRTPSRDMKEFAENLASVVASGRNLSTFLREQYSRYQEEMEAQQQRYLDLIATFAEAYVTVLVAGPLFFITVLVVIGLVLEDTLTLLRFVGYVGIPLATAGFAVYLDSITEALRAAPTSADEADPTERTGAVAAAGVDLAADGGVATAGRTAQNRERLALYDRLAPLRRWLDDPLGRFVERPAATFAITVPLGLLWIAVRLAGAAPGEGLLTTLDDPVIEVCLVVLGTAALAHEIGKRRRRAIDAAVPDFLDRMASVNEAGVTVVESLGRVSRSDLGALDAEIRRTRRDVRWGSDVGTALRHLDRRVGTPAVSRAVTLIANATASSGDIAPVLRIAADEAQAGRRLRRQRRQEMFTYVVVIYVSFLVFLGIVAALTVAFIPAIEAAASTGASRGSDAATLASAGIFSATGDSNAGAYVPLFFHVAAIQGVCSGVVAGQLGEESVYDGLKHATLFLAISYALFFLI